MGLFNKTEEVPTIPTAPTLPELPKPEKKDLPELPSFPMDSRNSDLNQEMVKSAVTDMPSPEEKEMYMETPKELHTTEEPEDKPAILPGHSVKGFIPTLPSITESSKKAQELTPPTTEKPIPLTTETSAPKQIEPIFVRIDKFQAAHKNFEEIKNKIEEIESVLKKIKDIRSHEEIELKGWTEDIKRVKSRLAEVDANIFNQI